MKDIISVINQKGGVGKSTTALSIGSALMLQGFKVLLIDLDAQCNLSHTMGATSDVGTSFDLLTQKTQKKSPEWAIQTTKQGDIIPASPELSGADAVITQTGKEYRLKEVLEPIAKKYDYIVIDTPPALGILTINALTACSGAIIPAQADIYSLQGITQLRGTIETVKRYCNPTLKVFGIVLTRYNSRAILNREVAEMIEKTADQLQTKLYKTTIRECIAIRESQAVQSNVFSYAPKSNASVDYRSLVDEFLKGEKQR